MSTVDTRMSRVDRRLSFGQMGVHANISSIDLLFLSFWHHSEQLWKKLFFPLEKVKILRIFSQNWSSEGG